MKLTFPPAPPRLHAGPGEHGQPLVADAGREPVAPAEPADGPVVDWSVALHAVPTRLRQIVRLQLAAESGLTLNDTRARIQLAVLESATAMGSMNVLLRRQLQRCHRMEPSPGPDEAEPVPAAAAAAAEEADARLPPPLERLSPMAQRRLFRHRLDRALADAHGQGAPLALLTIDLEGFRPIAEAHGPVVSDAVLRIIAARVSGALRATDQVARIGVQEFGCRIPGAMTRHQLGQVASKIFDAVSSPLRVGALWLEVAPSIGIAHGNAGEAGAAGMLLGANGAMLQARQQDSGYAFFEPPFRHPRRPDSSPRRAAIVKPAGGPRRRS